MRHHLRVLLSWSTRVTPFPNLVQASSLVEIEIPAVGRGLNLGSTAGGITLDVPRSI